MKLLKVKHGILPHIHFNFTDGKFIFYPGDIIVVRENEFKLTQIAGSGCTKCEEFCMVGKNGRKMYILKGRGKRISRKKLIE
jgi:hypothetical protein